MDANATCQICHRSVSIEDCMPAELVNPDVVATIRKRHPDWVATGYICQDDLDAFRTEYVEDVLEEEIGELSSLEQEVLRSMQEREILSKNVNAAFERERTFGERVADRVAEFGGSWSFLAVFAIVMITWMTINASSAAQRQPFDPYPFILLNLVLSCLAAVQAPIIMMSQNRQEARDRIRAEHDYRINLQAELEIRHLNAKMDLLLRKLWSRMVAIQKVQMELLSEVAHRRPPHPGEGR